MNASVARRIAFFLLCPLSAAAAEPTREEKLRYLEAEGASAEGTRRLGIALTIAAGVVLGGGGTLLGLAEGRAVEAAALHAGSPGTQKLYLSQATTYRGLGWGLLALGAVSAGLGVVFWVLGEGDKSARQKQRDAIMLGFAPHHEGASFVVSTTF
jgi:hypothetical protein